MLRLFGEGYQLLKRMDPRKIYLTMCDAYAKLVLPVQTGVNGKMCSANSHISYTGDL